MEKKGFIVAALKAVRDWAEPAFHELAGRIEALSARIDNLPRQDHADTEAMVKAHVAAAVATLQAGEKVEPAQIRAWLDEMVAARMSSLPRPLDGKDADPEQTRSMLDAMLAERLAAIPAPLPGKDADMDALAARLDALVEAKFAALPAPKDGKDADPIHPDTLRLMIMSCTREVLAEWPKPKDGEPGKSVDLDTLTALIDAKVTTKFAELPRPQDGMPGKDADLTEVQRLIDIAADKVRAEIPAPIDPDLIKASGDEFFAMLEDLADELENAPIMQAGASPISVSVVNGGERYMAGAEPLMVADLSAQMAQMKEQFLWPTVPVYKDGRIVGAKRVPPDQFGNA